MSEVHAQTAGARLASETWYRGVVEAALARALAQSADLEGMIAIELPTQVLAPSQLAAAVARYRGALWRNRQGAWTVGIGVAHLLEGTPAVSTPASPPGDRFAAMITAAQRLRWGRVLPLASTPAASDPQPTAAHLARLMGGFAFTAGALTDPLWQGFADAQFILPRLLYRQEGTQEGRTDGALATLHLFADANELRRNQAHAAEWIQQWVIWHDALMNPGWAARPPYTAGRPAFAPAAADRASSGANALRHILSTVDEQRWHARLADIRRGIADGIVEKVVAARSVDVEFTTTTTRGTNTAPAMHAQAPMPTPAAMIDKLAHEQAHSYLIALAPPAATAIFVAAPPERLVARQGVELASEALAGSAPNLGNADGAMQPTHLLNDEKNRNEHQLVVDAVTETFATLGVALAPTPPTTVRTLRHIHHLHTPVTGTWPQDHHVLTAVAALHPTPAVGGTPRALALQWIERTEPPRGYYAAPVGWFAPNGDGEFAVAIRCALVHEHGARLWAGAGIVAGSDAAMEFAETQTKLRVMASALDAAPSSLAMKPV